MSPLDDELRALFSSRADVLSPAADPLAGIERRARRMRRNRVAASVAGTALAVSALAVTVPALLPDTAGRAGVVPATRPPSPAASPSASPTPSAAPSPTAAPGAAALDPQNPWDYRGDRSLIAANELASLRQEWTTKYPGTTLTPLYGSVYEPSAQPEIWFVSTAQGSDRWGIATSSDAGWEFVVDQPLAFASTVLMAALSGDEVPRLLVLAAPSTGDIGYAADGSTFRSLTMYQPGFAVTPLEGDLSRDAVRVLDGNGDLDAPVFVGPAPDPGGADGAGSPTGTPVNLVDWPARGVSPKPDFLEAALSAFAQGLGARRPDVEGKVLFHGDDDAGNRFLFGQAWIKGNDAHTFGYSVNGMGEATPFLGPVTGRSPAVLAFVVAAGTGQSRDTLVVIPDPAVQRTFYGPAASEYSEITGQDHLGGVSLVDQYPDQNGQDMLKLLDANGSKIFEGPVGPLLCGVKGCG